MPWAAKRAVNTERYVGPEPKKKYFSLTFTLARDFIPEHVNLVNATILLEHDPKFIFVHRPGNLAHEHLDEVRVRLLERARPVRHPVRFGVHTPTRTKKKVHIKIKV